MSICASSATGLLFQSRANRILIVMMMRRDCYFFLRLEVFLHGAKKFAENRSQASVSPKKAISENEKKENLSVAEKPQSVCFEQRWNGF